jgi:hypothetical protein
MLPSAQQLDAAAQSTEALMRQLSSRVRPHINAALQAFQPGMCHPRMLEAAVTAAKQEV